MKSIEDVIKGLDTCIDRIGKGEDNCPDNCPYVHCCDPENVTIKADAAKYLKEYQSLSR